MNRHPIHLVLTAIVCLAIFAVADQTKPNDNYRTIHLTIHPAPEPVPTLKYHLLPQFLDQTPGNAALLYYQAIEYLPRKETVDYNERFRQYRDMPLNELPLKEAQEVVDRYGAVIEFLEKTALLESCDWQLPVRTTGYDMRLPSLGAFRESSKALNLKTRLQILHNQPPQALLSLQATFAQARYVANAPLLVQNLVGLSIAKLAVQRTEEFIQMPEAPNLYWALSALPRPFIDMQDAIRYESEVMLIEFPQLRDIDSTIFTAKEATDLGYHIFRRLMEFSSEFTHLNGVLPFTGWVAIHYTDAKQYLSGLGKSPQDIKAMPAAQAVILYQWLQFQIARDHMFKWFNVPYAQSAPHLKKAEDDLDKLMQNNIKNNLFLYFLPALSRAYYMPARLNRRIAALRCVEAIRLYAAEHNQLPQSLNDITKVIIPTDPVTGNAFDYDKNGHLAVLSAPPPEYTEDKGLRYEITLKINLEN